MPDGKPVLCGRRKKQTLAYIESNLERSLTLADIANAAALSPFHFARAFKATMGVTPLRYVWARRVEASKAMLRQDDAQLIDVAAACGFASQSSFTTAFKMATGMTPAVFRRNARHLTASLLLIVSEPLQALGFLMAA